MSVSLGKGDQHQISLYIFYLSLQVERDVLDHVAQIKAPSYLPTNDVQIPTGTYQELLYKQCWIQRRGPGGKPPHPSWGLDDQAPALSEVLIHH